MKGFVWPVEEVIISLSLSLSLSFLPQFSTVLHRAVDPHSFFADLDHDPAVFLNPDSAALKIRIQIQLSKICKNNLMKSVL